MTIALFSAAAVGILGTAWFVFADRVRFRSSRRYAQREYARQQREAAEEQRAWRAGWGGKY